jgi:hypothetical protein
VPVGQLLPALTWHVMQDTGTLAEHLFQLFRTPLADSSWSDRRLRLPWEIFAELMRRALRLGATARQHREAFRRLAVVAPDDAVQSPHARSRPHRQRDLARRAALLRSRPPKLLNRAAQRPAAGSAHRRI